MMMIGRRVTTCHKDGEADQGAITWREEMVKDRALIDKMKVMLKLHRQSMEEDDDIIENMSQSLIRVGKGFNKWRSAHKKQEYSVSLLDGDKDEGYQTTGWTCADFFLLNDNLTYTLALLGLNKGRNGINQLGGGDKRAVTELGFAHVTTKSLAYLGMFSFFRKKFFKKNAPPPRQNHILKIQWEIPFSTFFKY